MILWFVYVSLTCFAAGILGLLVWLARMAYYGDEFDRFFARLWLGTLVFAFWAVAVLIAMKQLGWQ